MGLVNQEEKNRSNSNTQSATDAFPAERKEKVNLDSPKKLTVTGATSSPSFLTEEPHDERVTTAWKADEVCARNDKEVISGPNSPSILACNFDSVATDDIQFDSKADQSLEGPKNTVDVSFHLDKEKSCGNGERTLEDGAHGMFLQHRFQIFESL